jgi:hypothetical protein
MRKYLIKFASVAVVAMIAGVNVVNSQKTEVLSDIAMANVEALANDENGRCPESNCKRVLSGTCYYYNLDALGNICETGEKRPFAYDPYNLMGI